MRCETGSERGFSLAEVLVASLLLMLSVVSTFTLLSREGSTTHRSNRVGELTVAAANLMEEVRTRKFEDPVSPVFGLEAGEVSTNKATFDDVDDFCGWIEAPPRDGSGSPLPGMDDVRLSVRVWYGNDQDTDGQSDTNASTLDDNGHIQITIPLPAAAITCANPGTKTRFKVIEVTAKALGGLDTPAPIVVRSLRFK